MALQTPRHSAHRVNRAQTVQRVQPARVSPARVSPSAAADYPGPIAPYASIDHRPGGKAGEAPAARQAGGAMIAGIVIVASLVAGLSLPAVVGWFNAPTTAQIADDSAPYGSPPSSSAAATTTRPRSTSPSSPTSTRTPGQTEPDNAAPEHSIVAPPALAEPTSEGIDAAITLSIQGRHTLPGAPITVTVSGSKSGHLVEVGIIVGGRPQWLSNQYAGPDGSTSALVTIPDNLIGRYSLTGLDTVTGILSVPIPIIISAGGGVDEVSTASSMAATANDVPTTQVPTDTPTATDQDSGAGLAAAAAGPGGGGSGPSISAGAGIIAWLLVLFVPVAAAIVRFNGRRRRWRPSRLGIQQLT
jgi:hypothetical protein